MALVKKGTSTKQTTRLIAIFIIIGVVGSVVIVFISRTPSDNLLLNTTTKEVLPIVKQTGLDLLENKVYQGLVQHSGFAPGSEQYGYLPMVEKGIYGKLNPFTSFVK